MTLSIEGERLSTKGGVTASRSRSTGTNPNSSKSPNRSASAAWWRFWGEPWLGPWAETTGDADAPRRVKRVTVEANVGLIIYKDFCFGGWAESFQQGNAGSLVIEERVEAKV